MELVKTDTTGIKGIAIMLMLWHHLFLSTVEYGVWANSFAGIAKLCVALFLFVSGYGLTKQYAKLEKLNFKNTVKFLLKRYANFFLPYWFCFVLVVVAGNLAGYTFQDAYPASRNTLKCFLLDIWGQMGYGSYLPTWWFNKMILQLYLLFPLFFLLSKNRYVAIATLLAIIPLQLNALKLPGNVFFVVEGGTPAFFLGCVFSQHKIVPRFGKDSQRWIAFGVALLLVVALGVAYFRLPIGPYEGILIRAALAVAIVFAYISFPYGQRKVLPFIGRYATVMYLVHTLFLRLIPQVIYAARLPVLIYLVFFAIVLGSAMLVSCLQRWVRYDRLKTFLENRINRLP